MSILQYLHAVGVSWQGVWPTMLQCLIVSCPVEMNMDQSRSIRSWNMRSHFNVNTQELLVVTSPSLFYNFLTCLKKLLPNKSWIRRWGDNVIEIPTLWKHFCSPWIYLPQNPFSHIWVLLLAPLWTLDLFSNASHRMRNCVKENEMSPLAEVTRKLLEYQAKAIVPLKLQYMLQYYVGGREGKRKFLLDRPRLLTLLTCTTMIGWDTTPTRCGYRLITIFTLKDSKFDSGQ